MQLGNRDALDRILRVHTAARQLGCSTRTVRRHVQQHKIPAVRIGRRAWGIRASDLNRTPDDGGGHVRD